MIRALLSTRAGTYYIYTFDGRLLAEYDISGICLKDYIYMGSRLIAEYNPTTSQYFYYTQDQIGSTRIVTDDTGTVLYAAAHDPYGGIQKVWVDAFDPRRKFSDKERDGETGLDYFGARYYTSPRYRWLSVDPVISPLAINDSQNWNLYSYSRNNPVTLFDSDGRCVGGLVMGLPIAITQAVQIGVMSALVRDFLNFLYGYISSQRALDTLIYGERGLDKWLGTDYGEVGENSRIGVSGDCSGIITWGIREYNPLWVHQSTRTFVASTKPGGANDNILGQLIKGWVLQAGDIAWWPGHVAAYAYRKAGVDYMYNAPGLGRQFRIQPLSGLMEYFGAQPIWFRLYRY